MTEPSRQYYVLFVDIMGAGDAFDHPSSPSLSHKWDLVLHFFSADLDGLISNGLGGAMSFFHLPSSFNRMPVFIGQFSDCAFLVFERFAPAAVAGALLMRCALVRRYPLRAGIGYGTFAHSGTTLVAQPRALTWSTASFHGSGVVRAYRAERCAACGLRVFVHPSAVQRKREPKLRRLIRRLDSPESSDTATHEVDFCGSDERPRAIQLLRETANELQAPERALRHYRSTEVAIERMDERSNLPTSVPLDRGFLGFKPMIRAYF